jgi:hypothetical protein
VDPGVAIMQPSFPATLHQKLLWLEQGKVAIKQASKDADVIIITHYHYDHFVDFDEELYENKMVLVKNPNEYINDSQRQRAESFFNNICKTFGGYELKKFLKVPEPKEFKDPLESLPLAADIDFGDYQKRKDDLIKQGRKWFQARARRWNKTPKIPELEFSNCQIQYPEGKVLKFGKTKIRFTEPKFHGIEFSRVGWVFGCTFEYDTLKLLYSSDLSGPIIEDYAKWIIEEDPDIIVLDGPMTYMLGYLLTKKTLDRAINNAVKILKETKSRLIIYDHHLLREPKFMERTSPVWETAKKQGKKILTAAELLGKKIMVLQAKEAKN